MAASSEGSVLMEASAIAEAIVLILSISWLLLLSLDTLLWLTKADPDSEPPIMSGSAALPGWSYRAKSKVRLRHTAVKCRYLMSTDVNDDCTSRLFGSGSGSPLGDILSVGASKVLSKSSAKGE